MLAAGLVFLATYVLLSFQNIPGLHIRRPAAALLGAAAMAVFGVVNLQQAYRLVDFDTLVFILGMMIVIGYLEVTGFFEQVELLILRRAATTRQLLALLIASSGLLSALFMNDTICLMLTPVVLRLVKRGGLKPQPYLIALATSANIGSTMTPMGNPQNMIIALRSGLPFVVFAVRLLPVAAAGLVLDYFVLTWLYPEEFEEGREVPAPGPAGHGVRSRLLYVCLAATALLLGLFAFNVSPPLAALSVASLLILAGSTKPREAFKHVDWELLLMFAGLFVVMGGLRQSGLLGSLLARLADAASAGLGARTALVSGSSAVVSNIVSNVPCVVFFADLLPVLGKERSLWLALAMASTIAGNLTVIGSVANLIVFESAHGEAKVGFVEYLKAGAPLALFLIAAGTVYLTILP